MAVVRPDDLLIVDANIEFNYLIYKKLEIDLNHINCGKEKTREAQYTADDVIQIVKRLLDGALSDVYAERYYGKHCCRYFAITKKLDTRLYKIVFCHCTDREDTLGIITLFRLRQPK